MEASLAGGGSHQYKRGLWTEEEDKILMEYVEVHGKGLWNRIAKKTGLKRCGKSCRLRWVNYLSPNIKRGNFTEEEEDLIIRLHKLLGNRWSLIAGRVPGRTDNQVKNHWNTHLSKRNGCSKKQRTEFYAPNPDTKSVPCSKNSDTMTTFSFATLSPILTTTETTTATKNTNLNGTALFSPNAYPCSADGQNWASSPAWRNQLEQQMSFYQTLLQDSDEFLQFDFDWNNMRSLV